MSGFLSWMPKKKTNPSPTRCSESSESSDDSQMYDLDDTIISSSRSSTLHFTSRHPIPNTTTLPIVSTLESGFGGCMRLVQLFDPDDPTCSSRILFGVSSVASAQPQSILVVDAVTRTRVCYVNLPHSGAELYGIDCVAVSGGKSLLITGEYGPGKLLVSDWQQCITGAEGAGEGTNSSSFVSTLPEAPPYTNRIFHVPEWCTAQAEVYVGGGFTGYLHLYDIEHCRLLARFERDHYAGIWGLAADVRRGVLFSASEDRTVKLWGGRGINCEKQNQCIQSADLSGLGESLLYLDQKNLLIVGMFLKGTEVWDVRKLTERLACYADLELSDSNVQDMDRVADGIVASVSNKFLIVWKVESGKVIGRSGRGGRSDSCYGVRKVVKEGLVRGDADEMERFHFLLSEFGDGFDVLVFDRSCPNVLIPRSLLFSTG